MGGGTTIAAALALGYESIGIESDPAFFKIAERAIPRLAELGTAAKSETRRRHQRDHESRPAQTLLLSL
ncbi:MAG: hypothetical protein ACLQOO_23615 [Terriglobia bacterium]